MDYEFLIARAMSFLKAVKRSEPFEGLESSDLPISQSGGRNEAKA